LFSLLSRVGLGAAHCGNFGSARSAERALLQACCCAGDCVVGCAQRLPRYFNPLAGKTAGFSLRCDLDCGRTYRLAEALRANTFRTCTLHVDSADFLHGIAEMEVLAPFTGYRWVAISARSLRFGDVFHTTIRACLRLIDGTRRNSRWARRWLY